MREHVSRQKKTTTGFSIPSLKQPIRGFGLESSAISRQAIPKIQPLHKPVTHDISRISLRSQAKLSISQPGDKYEQEADSVAQQVMQRITQPVNQQSIHRETLPDSEELQMKPLANSITPLVQREALPEDEEELQMKSLDNRTLQREALPEDEEELQMKSLDNRTLQREALPEDEEELQMKSLDNRTLQREALPEDEEELQMKSLDNRTLQREALPEDEEELQMKSLDNRTLQREALPEDEEELQMKPMVQRQANAGMAATPDLEASINQARGGGQSMADNIREPMEVAFGADFSGVKVHTDGQSDHLNRSIQARAFTTGQDVFFRSGEYNPGSRSGQELLAHELTPCSAAEWGGSDAIAFTTTAVTATPCHRNSISILWRSREPRERRSTYNSVEVDLGR
ncbi:eCIS core domain-containing protein [Nostoc sp. DSM 114160]